MSYENTESLIDIALESREFWIKKLEDIPRDKEGDPITKKDYIDEETAITTIQYLEHLLFFGRR